MRASLALLLVLSLTAAGARAATPEARGVWVSTSNLSSAASPVFNPATTEQRFSQLRSIGLNTVYMDVWRNGYTYYPSPTLRSRIGVDRLPSLGSRDLLRETLTQAHRNGMHQIAWFQYGFAAGFAGANPATPSSSSPLANSMRQSGWLLQDRDGNYNNATYQYYWMNPLVPQVRQFLAGVILDAVHHYDLDGVQFDDRLAWPAGFGYDAVTRAAYAAEFARQPPASSSDADWANWLAWRSRKVTDAAVEIVALVRAARPDVIVSVAPSVHPFGYTNYAADYPAWRDQTVQVNGESAPLFDEIIPQVYRGTYSTFDRDWDGPGGATNAGQVQYFGDRRGDFAAGIAIRTSLAPGGVVSASDLGRMIDLVRSTAGVAGHVLWFSDGVLIDHPETLRQYYDVERLGHAPRPDRPTDWRPGAIVASRAAPSLSAADEPAGGALAAASATYDLLLDPRLPGDLWQAILPVDARYSLITRDADGAWRSLASLDLRAGLFSIKLPGVTRLELLIDRRASTLAAIVPEPSAGVAAVALLLIRRRRKPRWA